jgi:hypothetical protein
MDQAFGLIVGLVIVPVFIPIFAFDVLAVPILTGPVFTSEVLAAKILGAPAFGAVTPDVLTRREIGIIGIDLNVDWCWPVHPQRRRQSQQRQ